MGFSGEVQDLLIRQPSKLLYSVQYSHHLSASFIAPLAKPLCNTVFTLIVQSAFVYDRRAPPQLLYQNPTVRRCSLGCNWRSQSTTQLLWRTADCLYLVSVRPYPRQGTFMGTVRFPLDPVRWTTVYWLVIVGQEGAIHE